ncbi:hypothetical protein MBRA1_000399 [Malassezia brasiliensis]|uniref:Allergen n=1 Tax=Malassezia brasiliensis TaxID=1821822 RepID=A0AAF0DS56_9BASI|nr:hypothetical protein MBRA1_000399 [Malassezia brasiliensis]
MSNVIKKVFNTDKAEGEAGKVGETAQDATSKVEQSGSQLQRGEETAKGAEHKGEGILGDAREKISGMFGNHHHHGSQHGAKEATSAAGVSAPGVAATSEKTTATAGVPVSQQQTEVVGVQPSESAYNRSSNLTQTSSVNSGVNVAAGNVDQDVQHLAPVTRETLHRQEIEELHREREHHIHQHHIQHHVQPVLDQVHLAEQLHTRVVPTTTIREVHANTDKDAALLRSVAGTPKDTYTQAPIERSVIDKGETVREIVHHHIHNIVQPIIEKDVYEYHRIRTTVPTTQITHEAPIVHESTAHQPIRKEDFVKGGGVLTSETRSVEDAGLLNLGTNQRSVEGETYTGGAPWTQ